MQVENDKEYDDLVEAYVQKRDSFQELPMPHWFEETDLDKLLRRDWSQKSTVAKMQQFLPELPTLHTYHMGRHGKARLYLEIHPICLTQYYTPPGTSHEHHPATADDTPFIHARYPLEEPHDEHDADGPPQSMRQLYNSKMVHIGIINAEVHSEDGDISTYQTPFAAVAQLTQYNKVSGIYAIPLDLWKKPKEGEDDPTEVYDLENLWWPKEPGEEVGEPGRRSMGYKFEDAVYYIGKDLAKCRTNEWVLVSKKRVEVICFPLEEW